MIDRNTWLILGAFALILLVFLLWNISQSEDEPLDLSNTDFVPALWQPIQIQRIVVEDKLIGVVADMQRDPDDLWLLTRPVEEPADAARVERAATWLTSPVPRQVLDVNDRLEDFSLAPPRYEIRIYLADGTRRRLWVGRQEPTSASYYGLVPGIDRVFLVSQFGVQDVLDLADVLPLAPESPVFVGEDGPTPAP